jgi:DNA-binding NtrC family response regulator
MIMPHMPGDELFYKLCEIHTSVSVLIASGYSSDSRTKAILKDGALGFIQKPFAVEELAYEVRRCLDA